MAAQLVHATVFVISSARSSIAAPQLRQLKPAVLPARRRRRRSSRFESDELVELDERADEQQRRRLAVVERREVAVRRLQIGEEDRVLVPVLERQLALDAAVPRLRPRRHREVRAD